MLTILPLSEDNCGKFNQADARFLASDRIQLRVGRKGFDLEYLSLPTAEWRNVKPFPTSVDKLLGDRNTACYLASVDGQYAGQCVVRLGAHRLGELLDIRTDSRYRRQGVGRELLNACLAWVECMGCAGLRVEVTDEQPIACQFFEYCGFVLGGVDRLLHAADPEQAKRLPAMRESVLVFYKFLERM